MYTSTNDTWFLAQLKPNGARIAQENLERQGFKTFLPQEVRTLPRGGRFITALKPFFPGYIFVLLDASHGLWRQVNSTRGVTKLVALGRVPTLVPAPIIQELMARCDDNGQMQPVAEFSAGDTLSVTSGPFADFLAKVQSIDADRRIWVLMDVMGRQTKMSVAPENLRKV